MDDVTVTLSREQMQRIWEVVIARAVACEAAEEVAMASVGSRDWREPANAIQRALSENRP